MAVVLVAEMHYDVGPRFGSREGSTEQNRAAHKANMIGVWVETAGSPNLWLAPRVLVGILHHPGLVEWVRLVLESSGYCDQGLALMHLEARPNHIHAHILRFPY